MCKYIILSILWLAVVVKENWIFYKYLTALIQCLLCGSGLVFIWINHRHRLPAALYILTHLIFKYFIKGRFYNYLCIKAQKWKITITRLHLLYLADWSPKPWQSYSSLTALNWEAMLHLCYASLKLWTCTKVKF